MKQLVVIVAMLLTSCSAMHSQASAGSDDFEKMKQLLGVWESQPGADGSVEKVAYRVTNGGTTIEETLFPGTPQQMTSDYSVVDGVLEMRHDCALGNAPRLIGSTTPTGLHFSFVDGENITPGEGRYINEMFLEYISANQIRHQWNSVDNGLPGETKIINFKRKS